MARGKLIFICQFGGNIVKDKDGSLSYVGGEANALYANNDTLFGDLKLKLAEICNMEHESMSIKYFLPGNRLVLINLSNDKDLKRMLAFHSSSVTADVFVFGKEGFDRDALKLDLCRASGIKLAETVEHVTPPAMAVDRAPSTSVDDHENPSHSQSDPEYPGNSSWSPATADMTSTPADTVKRRRRSATEKVRAGVPDISMIDDDVPRNGSESTKRKKSQSGTGTFTMADNEDDHQDILTGEDNEDDIKKLLASWKEGIDGPGQEFKSAYEFRDALQKYAVAHRFTYKFKKNDANRVNGRCAAEGCSWKIHASWVPQTQSFRIRKMNKTHTCGGESWKNAHPAKNWLVNIIKKRLHSAPHCKPKDIANNIAQDFGMELKYAQVWRGVENAKTQLMGSKKEAYNQLPWLCSKIVNMNPDSVAKLSITDINRFQRLFICFRAAVHGFQNGCRPLLFLDSTSLRSKYQESLLVVSAVDGNDYFFPVAIAVVDTENDDGWIWFLDQLKGAMSIPTAITFISDLEKGLHELVLRVFETAEQGYSMYHLIESFKKNLKGPFYGEGRGSLLSSLMAAAITNNVNVFKRSLEQIKQVSPNTHDWLLKIEPGYWANSLFKGVCYNHITDNAIEALIELLDAARDLPIRQKIEAIVQMMADLMNTRRTESREWKNSMLTPSKEELLERETMKASKLQVLSSSESVFEVRDDTVNVMNLETRECSCNGWRETGIMPCSHAIAVFKSTGRNVYDFCSKYFTIESFKLTYSESVNPVSGKPDDDDEEYEEGSVEAVLPPLISRTLGEEKMKPMKPKARAKRVVCCTKCKAAGHNKATCKAGV